MKQATLSLSIATQEDIPAIIKLTRKFYDVSNYRNLISYEVEKLQESIIQMLASQDCIIILLKEGDNTVGLLAAMATEPLFSRDRLSAELAWWIDPEYRGTKWSLKLLDAYEYWAKNKAGCKACQMVCLEELASEKVRKIYERKGYRKVEEAFIKRLT